MEDLVITLDKSLLNDKDYDFFHYEESYELATCKWGTFYLTSCGELRCSYYDKEKDIYTNNYDDIIRYYVKNNKEFDKAIDNGKLDFSLNNWFEIHFFDNNGNYLEYFDYTDNVYGSIREGYNMFLKIMEDKECIKEIKEELKERGVINEE